MKIPQIIAHRGGRAWAPENTLAAFRRALESGVHGIELDVQRCASGELVVIHDEEISRTTNGFGLVRDCTLEELQRLSAGLWYDDEFGEERVPTLAAVLELLAGKCELNIELKNTPIAYPGMEDELLELLDGYPVQTLIISSFDHKLMATVHALAPHLKIALLGSAVFLDVKQTATAIGATYFHPEFDCLRPDIVEEAHLAGLKVNVWTCNDVAKWRHCVKMGVDGIITDDPEGLKDYLRPLVGASRETSAD